jgi:uncharacterized membrane protein YfcA
MEWTTSLIIQAVVAALLVGFTKTGVPGLGILFAPMMANIFGAKPSTGVVLPMLLLADLFALAYYRQHARWGIILRLLPWVLAGILLGCLALWRLTNANLGLLLGGLVFGLLGLKVAQDHGGAWLEEHLPHQWWFSAVCGVLAGFTTMVGNVAGGIMSIYLLSMGLEKHGFMGTGAWFYFIVNAIKVPFSASLGLIGWASLGFNLKLAPLVVIGALAGPFAFRAIPQKWFERLVLVLASLAALRLLYTSLIS